MSRLNRVSVQAIKYGNQTVNIMKKGRIQVWPTPEYNEVYILDNNAMYLVQLTETGDYLMTSDYLVTDTSVYEYLPPYVVVDPDNTGQWILSTQARHSDMSETTYFMSNSNYLVNDGTARVKVTVQGIASLALKYGCYSQYNDYVNLWSLDYDASAQNETTSIGNSVANTYNKSSNSAPNLTYTYTLDGGEHFFWVTYGKSSSGNSYEDRGYIGIATSLLQDRTVNNVAVYYTISPSEYFLSGGVYREKLLASDESEALPGNVLQSSLSETADTVEIDGSLYEAYYYYVTIKGVQVKTNEYVRGNLLSLVETHFLTGNSNNISFSNIRYHWNNGYTISIYFVKTGSYSGGMGGFSSLEDGGTQSYSPLEIPTYNNGFFLDFHRPLNTTSNEVTGSNRNNDNEWRIMWSSSDGFPSLTNNTIYRLDVQTTPEHFMKLYDMSGTMLGSRASTSGSSPQSSYDFYTGLYVQSLFITQYIGIGRIVVRDSNDSVLHDFMMTDEETSGNGRYVFKDFIENYSVPCTYTGTITDILTQNFRVRDLMVPEVEAHFLTGNTNATGFLNIRHKWDNGYKISLYWMKTTSYSEDMRGFCYDNAGTTQHSPLEICAYKNGWYLDFHSPASTSSDSVNGGDFDFRTFASSLTASTNTVYRFDVQISPYWIDHNNTDGTNIQRFNSTSYGTVQAPYNFYDGYYLQNLFVMKAVAVGRIVIRDASDNIIHDYIMTDTGASGNARYVLKDFIENYSIACSYTGTVTDVMTQNFTPAEL